MKTGVELIAEERQEQIEKHGRTVELDVKYNHGKYEKDGEQFNNPQLISAASQLIAQDDDIFRQHYEAAIFIPHEWNKEIWLKMMGKSYKERLVIAGALIAAEIDRLQSQLK
jgi:hypothetical protein